MIELLLNPAFTMAAAAIGGWFMKMKAAERENRATQHAQFVEALVLTTGKSIESADAAANRSHAGRAVAQFIACALIVGCLALCFFPGFFEAPAIVETVKESGGFLFGLIGASKKTEFQELNGFVHSRELWAGFGHIIAFYFGQRAAKA